VIFILVDDLGWSDLGCYGSSFYDTPMLDRLAEQSIRFTNAYAASPVCSPTRASIMTGKHPVRVGITDWIPGMSVERAVDPLLLTPEDLHNLPLEERSLAELFRDRGYRTFFAGKWHLGESEAYWPLAQGFDLNKGGNHKGQPTFPGGNGYYAPYANPCLSEGTPGEYLTDRLTDESIRFMESAGKEPFFLYLSFYTVHTPIQGCLEYDDIYLERRIPSMLPWYVPWTAMWAGC
jgi:arylsulfatase A-like enzyme